MIMRPDRLWPRAHALHRRLVAMVVVVSLALVWTLFAWKTRDTFLSHENGVVARMNREVDGLATRLEMSMVLTDEVLSDFIQLFEVRADSPPSDEEVKRFLKRRFVRSPFLVSLVFMPMDGPSITGGAPVSDPLSHPWFATLMKSRDVFAHGRMAGQIGVARKLFATNGLGAGTVLAVVDLRGVMADGDENAAGRPDFAALLDRNDRVLAWMSQAAGPIGATIGDLPPFRGVSLAGFAGRGLRVFQGETHWVASQQIRSYPLRLVTGMRRAAIFETWAGDAWPFGLVALGGSGLMLLLLAHWLKTAREEERAVRDLYRLHQAIDQLPASFIMTDLDANIVFHNPAFATSTGYDEREVLGKNPRILQSGKTPPETYRALWDHLTGGRPWRGEMVNKRKDGTVYWEDAVLAPLKDADGRTVNYVAIKTDITPIKHVQRQLGDASAMLEVTFEQAAIGLAQIDLDGRFLSVNAKLCEVFGSAKAAFGSLPSLIHPDDRLDERARMASLLRGEASQFSAEMRCVREDGREIRVLSSVSLVRDHDGQPAYFISAFEDVTERRALEGALARRTDELQRSNEDLQQFAYVASHDLQEPLRTVSNFLQLLDRRYAGALTDEAREFIAYAVDGSHRMSHLIRDLLVFARIDSQGGELRPTEIDAVIRDAADNLRTAIEESGAVIEADPMPRVLGDRSQLVSLFQNLIGNAVKYRKADVAPSVRITVEVTGDEARFAISDNGIGIDPQYHERIFVIFQRLHARDAYGGTGIGLAVCKRIVERHGGRIRVESAEGQGSAFRLTLKVAPPEV
ncbi:MAG: PAS domain S-box protein [Alphaproteobacteria bacterium]|nr:PAS domain S-box protein [Alphaproteobacteria bacterium]